MTTVQLDQIERPAMLFAHARLNAELTSRGSRSLDTALVGVWEDLRTRNAAPCLVCGGTMAGNQAEGGACADCGATLS
jgi:hypothetical protein